MAAYFHTLGLSMKFKNISPISQSIISVDVSMILRSEFNDGKANKGAQTESFRLLAPA